MGGFQKQIATARVQHVPVSVKGKAGKFRKPCLMSDVEVPVRKKAVRYMSDLDSQDQ